MTDASSASRGHGLRRDIDLLEALASDEAQTAGGLGVVQPPLRSAGVALSAVWRARKFTAHLASPCPNGEKSSS
ncbi:hypothetical protein [Streptomyces chiangmaiensis]|uniref:Uncharacterized protein n=1 Tax=Streptomyces chiangmaiensis TaxID=766497 RepID=A0ABU7FIH2_9ACTN|nr:hypothetical protein [Streptomyces chiangmaiensis]MED7823932.1 hypothetical protein [Streptomyces chiangmaiensis]